MNLTTQSAMPMAQHRLEPGDRFPDFGLPDQAGTVRSLYQRARGSGTAIFVDSDDALRASLRALGDAYQAARLDSVIVDDSAGDAASINLADPSGRFRQGLRAMVGHPSGPAGPRPLAILLDRNQRILSLSAEGDLARWVLARWSEEPPPPSGEIRQVAPVLTVPNVLSPADCRALIARWHKEGHEAGSVTSMVDGKMVERQYRRREEAPRPSAVGSGCAQAADGDGGAPPRSGSEQGLLLRQLPVRPRADRLLRLRSRRLFPGASRQHDARRPPAGALR